MESNDSTTPKPRHWKLKVAAALLWAAASLPMAFAGEREIGFSGEIPAVDAATVTFRHPSTNYTVKVPKAGAGPVILKRELDIDELADGQQIQTYTVKNKDGLCVLTRGQKVLVLEDGNAKEGIDGNRVIGRLVRRVPRADDPKLAFTTRDGKAVFSVKIGDDERLITMDASGARPIAILTTKSSLEAAKPGFEADVTVSIEPGKESRGHLVRATVYDRLPGGQPYYQNKGGAPTGVTAKEIEDNLAKAQANYKRMEPALVRLMPVKMTVTPELAAPGEPVTLRMEALAEKTPNAQATLTLNHLQTPPPAEEKPLVLPWKADGQSQGLTRYVCEVALPSGQPGQHLVRWKCDIGGDISEYYRNYAVVTPQTTICLLRIAHTTPAILERFYHYQIPCSEWGSDTLKLSRWANPAITASEWTKISRDHRRYGWTEEHMLNYFPWGGGQVRNDAPEVQRAALQAIQQMAPMLGFTTPGDIFQQYTMGNETVKIARELNYKSVTTLCTEFHTDGDAEINHYGHPERPYFVSTEDFRKTGTESRKMMIGLSQIQRHTLLVRNYRCAFCFDPSCIFDGAAGRTAVDEIRFSRLFDAFDGFFQLQESQTVPLVIQDTLQMNSSTSRPFTEQGNIMVVDYAVAKARQQPVVFATSDGVVDYYLRHYKETPETISYQQDYWAGFQGWPDTGKKPLIYPDYLQMENHAFCVYALHGELLPLYHYDYTKHWSYPDFGNNDMKRRRDGFGYPTDDHDRFAVTPKITETRGMKAARFDRELLNGGLEITLKVHSDQPRKAFPLAVWDIPREFQASKGWNKTSAGRFVPVKAPYTGNLNGFVVADLQKGDNVLVLTVSSPKRQIANLDIDASPLLVGKVFEREGQPMAYIAPARPWPVTVELTVPEGKQVAVAVSPNGELQPMPPGTHSFTIPKEQWARVMGLRRDELNPALKVNDIQ
jgi:hypothetical protein